MQMTKRKVIKYLLLYRARLFRPEISIMPPAR